MTGGLGRKGPPEVDTPTMRPVAVLLAVATIGFACSLTGCRRSGPGSATSTGASQESPSADGSVSSRPEPHTQSKAAEAHSPTGGRTHDQTKGPCCPTAKAGRYKWTRLEEKMTQTPVGRIWHLRVETEPGLGQYEVSQPAVVAVQTRSGRSPDTGPESICGAEIDLCARDETGELLDLGQIYFGRRHTPPLPTDGWHYYEPGERKQWIWKAKPGRSTPLPERKPGRFEP